MNTITVQNIIDQLESLESFASLITAQKIQVCDNCVRQVAKLYIDKGKGFYQNNTLSIASVITGISLPDIAGNDGKVLGLVAGSLAWIDN